jgi:tetratricopeptide (TPR) repeat protein
MLCKTPLNFNVTYKYLFALLIIVISSWSCNPTRDRRINREWHTLTGHYNVYFNGEQKLVEILQSLEKGHVNDFTRVLDVFPYGDQAAAKSISGPLDEVLKKASKSIQDHTVGRYTDDSYLLMGKAHFLKQDYFASIEAMQYINSKYKDKGLRPITTTWIVKSYMGLKKPDEAEAIMSMHLSEFGPKSHKGKEIKPSFKEKWFPKVPAEFNHELYATAAHVAIKQNKYTTGAKYLELAIPHTKFKKDKIRYFYILGQLYFMNDSISLANKYFGKILKMNAPYEFEFNASINIARAYDPKDKSSVKRVRKSLKRMLKDEKNDGMYDQIHYELGKLEYKEKNINDAIKQYKLSVQKSSKNQNQKALSYLALGDIYLEIPDYKLAQAYYDSTATSISKEYKDYKKIIDKKDLLSELISHLIVIETQDSLQKIALLSPSEIEKKIDQWILAEQIAAQKAQREEALRKDAAQNAPLAPVIPPGGNPPSGFANMSGGSAQWYFYNTTTVNNGMAEFLSLKKWGRRANQDYWRLSKKQKEAPTDDTNEMTDGEKAGADKANKTNNKEGTDSIANVNAMRKDWIKDVPFTEDAKQRSTEKTIEAYYEIGMLYDEKLLDYTEAIKNFDQMLIRFPGNKYEAEILYRLYKLHTKQLNTAKAASAKSQLLSKYPESPFALILQNKKPQSPEEDANKDLVKLYESMYASYQANDFQRVMSIKKESDTKFPGNSMRARFDLLNTLAIGKTQSLEVFKSELSILTKEYTGTEVAEYAKSILDVLNKKDEPKKDTVQKQSSDFIIDENIPHYYVFAVKVDKFDNNEALSRYNAYNEEFESVANLRVNSILANDGYQLIYVVQFPNLEKALKYTEGINILGLVKKQINFQGPYLEFAVSVANFRKMLKEQKTSAYNAFFQEYKNALNQRKQ